MAKQPRADEGGTPWCIQPELTEGCSMSKGTGSGGLCSFCGLNAIRSGPGEYKWMSVSLAEKIASEMAEFCPKARVEFAMRGEPLMNPSHLDIFAVFRKHLPKGQQMVTTNGDTLRGRMHTQVNKMFEAGLSFILLDTYYPEDRRTALRDEALALDGIDGITVLDYFDDMAPIGESPYANHGTKFNRHIVLMDDLLARDGEHSSRQVKTHAGANPIKQIAEPFKRNCGRPFREMTIAYNGDVTLCCDDWRKEYIVENAGIKTLREIWSHPRFEAARARLMQKDRDWGICKGCDAPMAPRTGLLPAGYEIPTPEELALTEATYQPKEALWKKI